MQLNMNEVCSTLVVGLALLAGWLAVRILINDWQERRKKRKEHGE